MHIFTGFSSNGALQIFLIDDSNVFINIFFAYWIMRKSRMLFFYLEEIEAQKEWNNSIDHMNTGFVSLRQGKIPYVNKQFIDVAIKLNLLPKKDSNDINGILLYTNEIMLDIFSRCSFVKGIIDTDEEDIINEKDNKKVKDFDYVNRVFEQLNQYCQLHGNGNKMKSGSYEFIGNLNIAEASLESYYVYEVYCRYDNKNDSEGDHFDFIFNNITRTKLLEEKNGEIRIKSAFLSKIAHEFKNPLICMSEIIDTEFTLNEKNEWMMTIKSISNYLLILIKNIDFFATMQLDALVNKKETLNQLTLTQCSLYDVFEFITLITNYLIKRKQAEKVLNFQIINYTKYTEIETDEVKLKQLLINLISNSLKFTTKGSITLSVYEDEDDQYIRFSVKDTGIGISETERPNIFIPFAKGSYHNVDNLYETGLGLSIAQELACALGKGIDFDSEYGKGTEFWFDVLIGKSNEHKRKGSTSSIINVKDESLSFSIPMPVHMLYNREKSKSRSSVNIPILNVKNKAVTVLVVDDEELIRRATIRKLKNYCNEMNIVLTVYEASDGVELLWVYYDKNRKNDNIDLIISDENMDYYSGNQAVKELETLSKKFKWKKPRFYLSLSHDYDYSLFPYITGYFQKPIDEEDLNNMLF